jgi:hypothetical protein
LLIDTNAMNLTERNRWFSHENDILHDARRQITSDAKLSPEFVQALLNLDTSRMSQEWYASLVWSGQRGDDIRARSTATLNGLRAAMLAADAISRTDSRLTEKYLRESVNAYQAAWGLTATGSKAKFMEVGKASSLPRALQAMLDAKISVKEGTAPAWLAVYRLIDYLTGGAGEATLNLRATPGTAENPVQVRILFDAGTSGRIVDATATVQTQGPSCWYVDPLALGATVLTADFVASLQLGWHASWSASVRQQTLPIAVRITPELQKVSLGTETQKHWLLAGPSAGALMACAMYAAVTGTELDTNASASVALKLKFPHQVETKGKKETSRIDLSDLLLSEVGGVKNKLEAAHRVGLGTVVLSPKDYQEALQKRWHIARSSTIRLVKAESFQDVFRELSGNSRMELALDEFSRAQARDWDEAWTGASDLGRQLGLANYVPPRYALLRPDRESRIKNSMRRTHGPVGTDDDFQEVTGSTEEEVLLSLLEQAGPLLCLSEGPGAGKTVFTRRLLGFISSQLGRDALFGGRGCLAMRWEDGTYGRRWPKNLKQDLLDYDRFRDCCAKHGCDPSEVYDYAVANGRMVIILDSLDQASKDGRQAVLSFLSDLLVEGKKRQGMRVILTGRPYAVEKIREARLPAASWRFGKVLPFHAWQQWAYLRGPQAPSGESTEAWRNRSLATGVTKPVLGLDAVASPSSSEAAEQILRGKISHYQEVGELLGNPQSLAYVRKLALKRKGKLSFTTRSELYAQVTRTLLREGIKRSTQRSATALELELANAMLSAAAFQMLIRDPESHVANGESTIVRLRARAERRFEAILKRSKYRGNPERAWAWLERVSVLTNRTLLAAASELTLAWPDRRLMEYYAGLHLANNAEPGWYREVDNRIRCGDPHVRRHAADERWLEPWRFAIEMPARERDRRVLLASVAELYEPVAQRELKEDEKPWLRPTELMYRAWCLLEELPAYERAQASPKLLAGGERVIAAYRAQFERQLADAGELGRVARELDGGFVPVPALENEVLALTEPHRISLASFLLGRTVVTREQYALFDGSYLKLHEQEIQKYEDRSLRCGAQWLSWYDAWCAARYFGGRLPTEAEWEYACGAGSRTRYCRIKTSDPAGYRDLESEEDLALVADFGREWEAGPRAVEMGGDLPDGTRGRLLPNAFGLQGMHGGLWEWCVSWYGESFTPTSLAGPDDGSSRVLRGGSWDDDADDCRTAIRIRFVPSTRNGFQGFRLARVR